MYRRRYWSLEHCRLRQVPEEWIDELSDCFESGFEHDLQTIYVGERVTNQYRGIRDVDLAQKLGRQLGLPVDQMLLNPPPAALWLLPFKTLQKR